MAARKTRNQKIVAEAVAGLQSAAAKAKHATLAPPAKVERLGRAMALAIMARGEFTESDARQAGFTKAETTELCDEALAFARTLEPIDNRRVAA